MSQDIALEFKSVFFSYDRNEIIRGIDFSVKQGEICSIIGPDGAGKTTLLKIAVGLLSPTKGTVRLMGFDPLRERRKVVGKFGYMPQFFSLYRDLTVEQNLRFYGKLMGIPKNELNAKIEELLELIGLREFRNMHASELSGGMKRKLGLICNLLHTPSLLILDEPTTGIDMVTRLEIWRFLFKQAEAGTTIVYSTPYLEEAEKASKIIFIHNGKVKIEGSPHELLSSFEVKVFKVKGKQQELKGYLKNIPKEWIIWEKDGARVTLIDDSMENTIVTRFEVERLTPTLEDIFLKVLWKS